MVLMLYYSVRLLSVLSYNTEILLVLDSNIHIYLMTYPNLMTCPNFIKKQFVLIQLEKCSKPVARSDIFSDQDVAFTILLATKIPSTPN